ncbi:MAG: glycerophosphodiester phosphodiesterase [Archangium sp.]|nr:glycerophosphodiester phosphodiesterase [Archangium sp.]MDP3152873.1 glycerophosphodiester phosphodiesterase [Archangium sp.]MDP3569032.1 glycerophosphodiester phosphodiesterase [Archangium sp.]
MKHAFFEGLKAPLHISHRGGAALYPENTMYAFERALKVHRSDVLELDVHASSDGEIVIAHDPTLERCTDGSGPLSDQPWSVLSQLDAAFHFTPVGESGTPLRGKGVRLPSFRELLTATPGVRLNVEVKSAGAVEPFVSLVKKEGVLDRLCIGSEHDSIAAELARLLPDACHFFPRDALAAFVLPTKGGEPPDDDPRYTVLDMPYRWEGVTLFDAELVKVAQAHGKWINVWTVDEEVEMRRCILEGVGGVMTDRPDVLRAVLDSR